jgi:hypothetical protein
MLIVPGGKHSLKMERRGEMVREPTREGFKITQFPVIKAGIVRVRVLLIG